VALRSFNSPAVGREFNGVFDKIRNSKCLVIDVRENTGGNTLNGYAIISRLIDKPLQGSKWRSPQYVSAFKSWGRNQKWYEGEISTVEPAEGKPSFLGPVVVLTSADTGSAAEDFLIPLHYAHRAKLVGERTAGTTGNPLVVPLPGGVIALICTKHDTYPDGKEFIGVGVIPDVEVHPTLQDVTAGRDVILEKGIEVAKSMVSSAPAQERR
jgi:carboxyl-terminal processing protease